MADATYPLIYRNQGATEFVVQSSGILSMDGSMDIGGEIDVESGGHIDIEDGGYLALPVVADTSSANLSNHGVSTLTNASSALCTFTLDAPVAGVIKTIRFDGTFNSTAIGYVDAGSTVITLNSTHRYLSAKEAYGYATLIGLSATAWAFIGHSTAVLSSTGSTA